MPCERSSSRMLPENLACAGCQQLMTALGIRTHDRYGPQSSKTTNIIFAPQMN